MDRQEQCRVGVFPYNPEHEFYNESKILDQAGRLLEFNDASGGSGVRYAVSNAEAQQHFTQLFEQHFPTEMQGGTLSVWHVQETECEGV